MSGSERRKYKHDPIVEALIDVAVQPGAKWTAATPGRFYERVKEDFPDDPEERVSIETGFVANQGDISPAPVKRKLDRVMYPNSDKSLLASLRPDGVSVHSLKPYIGWKELWPLAQRTILTAFEFLKPEGIRRVGVRYINQIDFEGSSLPLQEYFAVSPEHVVADGKLVSFVHRTVALSETVDPPIVTATTLADPKSAQRTGKGVILDIDVYRVWKQDMHDVELIEKTIRELRDHERILFEGMITDRLREAFDV